MLAFLLPSALALRPAPRVPRRDAVAAAAAACGSVLRPPSAAAAAKLTDEEKFLQNPTDTSALSLPPGCAAAKNVFLVFHGRGGPDRETDDLLARVRAQDAAAKFERTVALVDWRPYFESDAARISFAGQAVGRKLGRALFAEAPGLRTLHVVGTSAGAWPANEVCTAYVEAAAAAATKSRAAVILSLTDPFTQRADEVGAPDKTDGFGMQNYGKSADYAEHYLNADDIVPSTSAPLQNCFCFDVTRAAERASFPLPGGGKTGNPVKDAGMTLLGYHNWPMGYMARHYTTTVDARGELVVPTHADRPRGGVEIVA